MNFKLCVTPWPQFVGVKRFADKVKELELRYKRQKHLIKQEKHEKLTTTTTETKQ